MRFFAMICCCLLAATASAAGQTAPQAGDPPAAQPVAAQTEPSAAKPVEAAAVKPVAPATEAPTAAPSESQAKPAQASTDAPAAPPTEAAVSKPIDKPSEAAVTKAAATASEKSVDAPIEKSVAQPSVNKIATTPSVEEPAAKPLEAATEKPAAQPEASAAKPSEAPAAKPVEASTEKPAGPKVATAPVVQPAEPAIEKPVQSSIEKPVALPPEKPVAVSCPGHPDALGTSRVITVTPAEFKRIGSMQYKQELPLKDHEVVLTFDDGPIPPYTNVILDELAAQCVKATYFLVGEMAQNFPYLVRRIYNAGHTIGTHSQRHPLGFQHLSEKRVEQEVDGGIASVDAALGNPKALAPFFRIPGLGRSEMNEKFLAAHSLVTWSADVVADDWFRGIRPNQIVDRAIKRLNEKGRGILLLHDIHPATVIALPRLLKELKEQGYRVVQVVPSGDRPKSLPDLVATRDDKGAWPRVVQAEEKAEKTGARSKHHKHRKVARHHRKHHAKKHNVKRHHHRRHLAAQ
jgi:peptidoglycan/xylan/chitin deacetylase (PgdA/CDA1 family)